MRNTLITVLALGGIFMAGSVFAGGEQKHHANSESALTEHATSDAGEVGNKICPVSGEKVGEMGEIVKYEHEGKVYNLCCAMCAKDFKKNPEKYSAIADKEVMGLAHDENSGHMDGNHEGHKH